MTMNTKARFNAMIFVLLPNNTCFYLPRSFVYKLCCICLSSWKFDRFFPTAWEI